MKYWYVVQSKPKQEDRAEVNLEQQGYETYCPRLKQKRRYKGRWKEVIEPFFPRYLFVRLEQGRDDFAPIRSTIGVAGLVRFGGVPGVLPSGLIEEIKAREDETQGVRDGSPQWQPGDEIEIAEGALAGLKGLFLARSSEQRIVILLNMLGQENRVLVKQDIVVPA